MVDYCIYICILYLTAEVRVIPKGKNEVVLMKEKSGRKWGKDRGVFTSNIPHFTWRTGSKVFFGLLCSRNNLNFLNA